MGIHLRQNELQEYERSETQRLLDQADDFDMSRRARKVNYGEEEKYDSIGCRPHCRTNE